MGAAPIRQLPATGKSLAALASPKKQTDGQVIRRDAEGHETSEDVTDRRILLKRNERVIVQLTHAQISGNTPVVLRADNGGLIEDRAKSPEVTIDPTGEGATFAFQAGGDRGLYTVSVAQEGRDVQIIEFWVGDESPRGAAGPERHFTAVKQS